MTPERAKELLPIITAYANGEQVEGKHSQGWQPIFKPTFTADIEYRIKPKKVTLYVNIYKWHDHSFGTSAAFRTPVKAKEWADKAEGSFLKTVEIEVEE